MKRYPDGWQGKFFFQKDAPSHMPDVDQAVALRDGVARKPRSGGRSTPRSSNDELALLWMVNMGCIDLNAWYSRVDRPDRPDWVLFDLDPPEDEGFDGCVQVALLVRDALDALGLAG